MEKKHYIQPNTAVHAFLHMQENILAGSYKTTVDNKGGGDTGEIPKVESYSGGTSDFSKEFTFGFWEEEYEE